MTFLYTIFLTALAASLIPILLHILSRQRLPLIKFSSLEFLLKLQKRKARKIKLRQLILLTLRTLAVLAIVVAFARPALMSGEASGSAASVEMVIILDNSVTSLPETRDGRIISLLKERCRSLINFAGQGDRLTLIPAAQVDKILTAPGGQKDLIIDLLEDINPVYTLPDIKVAVEMGDSVLNNSNHFNRELYYLSSFYGMSWDSLKFEAGRRKARGFVLPAGPASLKNVSIEQVSLESSILQAGEPVELKASLKNYSPVAVQDLLVSLYLGADRVAQASISIPAEGLTSEMFTVIPDEVGVIRGRVKIDGIDPLTDDSQFHFILPIPDSIEVFCIVPQASDSLIISAALTGYKTGYINLHWGDSDSWETTSLAGYDVLILAGLNSVSAGMASRISDFTNSGGGVIIFQGKQADLSNLSRQLWKKLGFSGARGVLPSESIGWGKIDLKHPLFVGMFEKEGSPHSPVFSFAVDLLTGREDHVIVPFSNGRPFLIERRVGKGLALMYAVPLDPASGDFVFSGIIAPLIFRSVGYVYAVGNEEIYAWITETSSKVVLPLQRTEVATLETPDGNAIDLHPKAVAGGVEYEIQRIRKPGFYMLKIGDREVGRFAANMPTKGSNLRRTDLPLLCEQLGNTIIIDKDEKDLRELINSVRFGRELWQPIAAIFILLLLTESIVGRSWGRKES